MDNNITMKIRSKRTEEKYDVQLYQKDNALIIRHTDLDRMYWELKDEKRPKATFETVDMRTLPGVMCAYVVKCTLQIGELYIEEFGELTMEEWNYSSQITKNFPMTICHNRAFDRCFIRFMQFDISSFKVSSLYSSEEIQIPMDGVPINGKNIGNIPSMQEKDNKEQAVDSKLPDRLPEDPQQSNSVTSQRSFPEQNMGQVPQESDGAALYDNQMLGPYEVPAMENSMYGVGDIPPAPDFGLPFTTPEANGFSVSQFPDLPPMPDTLNMPPVNTEKKSPAVYRVYFDIDAGKTRIETDLGIIYYDPYRGFWEGEGISPDEIDLDHLYMQASKSIGMELKDFNGTNFM